MDLCRDGYKTAASVEDSLDAVTRTTGAKHIKIYISHTFQKRYDSTSLVPH